MQRAMTSLSFRHTVAAAGWGMRAATAGRSGPPRTSTKEKCDGRIQHDNPARLERIDQRDPAMGPERWTAKLRARPERRLTAAAAVPGADGRRHGAPDPASLESRGQ